LGDLDDTIHEVRQACRPGKLALFGHVADE
jgi:hypothetical protein